ncbi:hypothetical protein HDE_03483 [Halotydeus destructor]|nr:hypothetical protein HDE_03483 [Halotydeus destructor]
MVASLTTVVLSFLVLQAAARKRPNIIILTPGNNGGNNGGNGHYMMQDEDQGSMGQQMTTPLVLETDDGKGKEDIVFVGADGQSPISPIVLSGGRKKRKKSYIIILPNAQGSQTTPSQPEVYRKPEPETEQVERDYRQMAQPMYPMSNSMNMPMYDYGQPMGMPMPMGYGSTAEMMSLMADLKLLKTMTRLQAMKEMMES